MATAVDFEIVDFTPEFIEIFNVDKQLCSTFEKVVQHMMTCDENSKRKHQKALSSKQVQLSGSSTEGGIVSRLFMESSDFPDCINREGEVDIEFILLELPLSLKDLVVDVQGKAGFVKLKYHPEYLAIAQSLGWEVDEQDKLKWNALLHQVLDDDYFQPYKLKEYFATLVKYTSNKKCIELLLAAALKKRKSEVSIETKQSLTNATVDTNVTIKIDGKTLIKCCYDAVPLIRLQWWPAVANEWKERQRAWPSKVVIDNFTKVGYIIAKPSNKYDETTIELRYAFSHIEKELAKMHTDRQKIIYLMFKIIWVKYIKPFDPEKISSFIAKTVMFWACEQIHPEDDWWKRHYADVLESLFKRMLEAFEKGMLPYFFIQSINVIGTIPEELIENQIKPQLSDIVCFIDPFLPQSFDEITKVAKEVLHMSESVCEVFREIERRDYKRLIKQPELIADVLPFYINKIDLSVLQNISNEVNNNFYVIEGILREDVCENVVTSWKNVEQEFKNTTEVVDNFLKKDIGKDVVAAWKNIEENVHKTGDLIGDIVRKDIGKNSGTSWNNIEPDIKKTTDAIGDFLRGDIEGKDLKQEVNKTADKIGDFLRDDIGNNWATSLEDVGPEVRKTADVVGDFLREDIGENVGAAWKDVEREATKTIDAVGNLFKGLFQKKL